ncbi:hypothetical protein V8C86DRAFT_2629459 [Haematococcus lacustris]
MPTFELISESTLHKRYLTVLDRKVKITESNGEAKELHFDVVGHPRWHFSFACVLPFHTAEGDQPAEVTLIKEYAQGPNQVIFNLPCGGYEPGKHGNIEGCAAAELSEEAMLTGGELVRLIPDGHPGYAEVKWCANRFTPFLVIDPQVDPDPGARDAEEYIEVLRVPVPELRRLLVSGDMMLPSIVTANLALAVLESRGLL